MSNLVTVGILSSLRRNTKLLNQGRAAMNVKQASDDFLVNMFLMAKAKSGAALMSKIYYLVVE